MIRRFMTPLRQLCHGRKGFMKIFLRRCNFSNMLKEFHETLAPMLNCCLMCQDFCAVFLVPIGASGARTSAQQSEPAKKLLYDMYTISLASV